MQRQSKLVPKQAIKAYQGVEVWLHPLLGGSDWRVLRPGHFTFGEGRPIAIERGTGWASDQVSMLWRGQNVLCLSGIEQAVPVVQSVAYLLYRIRCPGCVNVAYLALLSATPRFMLQKNYAQMYSPYLPSLSQRTNTMQIKYLCHTFIKLSYRVR